MLKENFECNAKRLCCFIAAVLMGLICCGCTSEEDGPKEVVQRYFNALKAGDAKGARECFTPAVQQQYDFYTSLGGLMSLMLTGIDGSSLVDGFTSYATKDAYKNCTFIVDDVVFSDDVHEHALVHVSVEGATGDIPSEDTLRTVKYNDQWYVGE